LLKSFTWSRKVKNNPLSASYLPHKGGVGEGEGW